VAGRSCCDGVGGKLDVIVLFHFCVFKPLAAKTRATAGHCNSNILRVWDCRSRGGGGGEREFAFPNGLEWYGDAPRVATGFREGKRGHRQYQVDDIGMQSGLRRRGGELEANTGDPN